MQYESYERRIEKIASFLKLLFKHKFKIIFSLLSVILITVTLVTTKGVIISAGECPEGVVYGEELDYSAKAFLSKTYYEYKPVYDGEWTTDFPSSPGEYYVRAVAHGTSELKYGKEERFVLYARDITVTIATGSVAYGDSPSIKADLAYNDVMVCNNFIFDLEAGTVKARYQSVSITDSSGRDVTACYNVYSEAREVTILPRKVTVAAVDVEKVYDGLPLEAKDYTFIVGSAVNGDSEVVTVTGSATNVADSTVSEISCSFLDSKGNDVSEYYDVTLVGGKVTILPLEITLASGSYSGEYDGQTHANENYSITGGNVIGSDSITVSDWSNITDVGEIVNSFVATVMTVNESGDTVESTNYALMYEYGTLAVTPKHVAFTTGSAEFDYDGAGHTKADVLEVNGLLAGDTAEGYGWTTIIDAGELENTCKLLILTAEGRDVSANYVAECTPGTVRVNKKALAVTTPTEQRTYSGATWYNHSLITADGSLVGNDSFTVIDYTTAIDVGVYTNTVNFEIWDNVRGVKVTDNYDITLTNGTLTVTKRPITVITSSCELIYNGEEQFNDMITVPESQLIFGHVIEVVEITKVKDVISGVDNVATVIIKDGERDVTHNYSITYQYGKISVVKRQVNVVMDSSEKYYDGKEFSDNGFSVENMVQGDTLTALATTTVTDAGVYPNELLAYEIKDSKGNDIGANYSVNVINGTLTVKKRPVTVSTNSAEKYYDATPLTKSGWFVVKGSDDDLIQGDMPAIEPVFDAFDLVEGHTLVTPEPNGTITNVGTVDNGYDGKVEVYAAGNVNVTANYEITVVLGTLTVMPRTVSISTESYSGTYDGKDHNINGITVNVKTPLCEGHALTPKDKIYNSVVTNVENIVDYTITDALGNDVTANYVAEGTWGKVTILAKEISISSDGYEGVYDGNSHLLDTLKLVSGTLCDGHSMTGVDATVFKNVTSDTDNRITVKISDAKGNNVTSNYKITAKWGKVTILPREIECVSESYNAVYDGQTHNLNTLIVTKGTLCDGHTIIGQDSKFMNVVDNVENKVYNAKIYDVDGKEVSANYSVKITYGRVTITPREITVVTESYNAVYDGQEHNLKALELVDGELCTGHTLSGADSKYKDVVTNKQNEIKSVKVLDSGSRDVSANYKIIVKYGTVTITPRPLNITTEGKEWEYDGKEHSHSKVSYVNSLVEGHTGKVTGTTKIKDIGSVKNILQITISDELYRDVTANYAITIISAGTLTIKPASGSGTTDPSLPSGPPDDYRIGLGSSSGDGGGGDIKVIIIRSSKDGTVYLKQASYGDYNGQGFSKADVYDELLYGYISAYYLPAIAAESSGLVPATITITSPGGLYFLPYYSSDRGAVYQTTDTVVLGDASKAYSIYYYDSLTGIALPVAAKDFEKAYAEFVRSQYLQIPSSTNDYFQNIINSQGFSKADADIISKVAAYIQGAATYDLKYNRALDSSEDIAVEFLRTYKRGVCQHYAAAATMLFRALGIPARYTVGYVSDTVAGIDVEVGPEKAHAWVEVYIDGIGWMQVEVTGSGFGSIGGDISGGIDEGIDIEDLRNFSVTPKKQSKVYDSYPLYATNEIIEVYELQQLKALGYTYKVEVSGSQTLFGIGTSSVENFTLYDPYGKDVTDEFNITYYNGKLEVSGGIIEIYIYEKTFAYSGLANGYSTDEYVVCSIPDGVTFTMNSINISLTDVGLINSETVNDKISSMLNYTILDGNNNDVTSQFTVNVVNYADGRSYNVINITKRDIVVTTGSSSKEYDGEPLTNGTYFVSYGYMGEGHKLSVSVIGEITAVGEMLNTVNKETLKITDSLGRDVTRNYNVEFLLGTLQITQS